jgi:hypothetical protein
MPYSGPGTLTAQLLRPRWSALPPTRWVLPRSGQNSVNAQSRIDVGSDDKSKTPLHQ